MIKRLPLAIIFIVMFIPSTNSRDRIRTFNNIISIYMHVPM